MNFSYVSYISTSGITTLNTQDIFLEKIKNHANNLIGDHMYMCRALKPSTLGAEKCACLHLIRDAGPKPHTASPSRARAGPTSRRMASLHVHGIKNQKQLEKGRSFSDEWPNLNPNPNRNPNPYPYPYPNPNPNPNPNPKPNLNPNPDSNPYPNPNPNPIDTMLTRQFSSPGSKHINQK